ncbi:MAG TPA: hypothetical protein V6D31_09400 [Candidatus Sericytochromatia bacterium]
MFQSLTGTTFNAMQQIQPWYWRSLLLRQRTGSDVFNFICVLKNYRIHPSILIPDIFIGEVII